MSGDLKKKSRRKRVIQKKHPTKVATVYHKLAWANDYGDDGFAMKMNLEIKGLYDDVYKVIAVYIKGVGR